MKKRILLVAHEADVVQSVPITLRLAGHRVILAGCGLEAIKRARRLLPDLVLVDAALPDLDGPTVIDILRRLPSTRGLPAMLFQPRPSAAPDQSQTGSTEIGPPKSSELLQQVALALVFCGAEVGPAQSEKEA
jgi:CheY-like chemotaxis protein